MPCPLQPECWVEKLSSQEEEDGYAQAARQPYASSSSCQYGRILAGMSSKMHARCCRNAHDSVHSMTMTQERCPSSRVDDTRMQIGLIGIRSALVTGLVYICN